MDFEDRKQNFDKTGTFVYMKFFSFSKLLLASNNVSWCALKVRLTEYEEIENGYFHPENVYRNLKLLAVMYHTNKAATKNRNQTD